MRGELYRTTKLFQIDIWLANQIGRIYFVRLTISHLDIVQNYTLSIFSPKNIRYELRDSRNIQGFALIYEQSCYD